MSTTRRSYITDSGVEMRRISWEQLYQLRPDLRPAANDNRQARNDEILHYEHQHAA